MNRLVFVKTGLEAIIVLVLVVCFALQVLDGLNKFFQQQTSMMVETNNSDTVVFPQITMCRGYKQNERRKFKVDSFFDHNPERGHTYIPDNATSEEIQNWWKDQNYELTEFLTSARLENSKGNRYEIDREHFETGHETYQLTQLSSISGDCFNLDVRKPLESHEHVQLKFDIPSTESVKVYLHNKNEEFGIYWNFWPSPISFIKVTPGLKAEIPLSQSTTHYMNTARNLCDEDLSFPICVQNWLKSKLRNAQCTKEKTACRLPVVLSLMKDMADIPMCLTRNESDCMTNHVQQTIRRSGFQKPSVNGCRVPCLKNTISATILEDPANMPLDTMANIFFLFPETAYPMYSEYQIYDLYGILVMVGGSLGLYLGFSGRGFLMSILDFLWSCQLLPSKTPAKLVG